MWKRLGSTTAGAVPLERLSSRTTLWWKKQIDSICPVCLLPILLLKRRRPSWGWPWHFMGTFSERWNLYCDVYWKWQQQLIFIGFPFLSNFGTDRSICLRPAIFLLPPLSLSNLWKLPCLGRLEFWGKLFWVEWNDLLLLLQNPGNADQTTKYSQVFIKSSIWEYKTFYICVILRRGALFCVLLRPNCISFLICEHTATGSFYCRGKK